VISVIIPIYKVEKYLNECVKSILAQTYSDIEVILVDDGSPDGCPALCDTFAAEDSRITVIHKINGGLSSARNAGIEIAKGEWLAFIDSDDIIHKDMMLRMIESQKQTDSDIIVCDFLTFQDGDTIYDIESLGKMELFNSEEAVEAMFSNKGIGWGAWNKLYRKDLFDTIRYPEGVLCEDKATTYKLYLAAKQITYIREKLYYYRLRNTSITGNKSRKFYLDTLDVSETICNYFHDNNQHLYDCACGYAAKCAFLYMCELKNKPEHNNIRLLYVEQLHKYYKYVNKVDFISPVLRYAVFLTAKLTRKDGGGILSSAICGLFSIVLRSRH